MLANKTGFFLLLLAVLACALSACAHGRPDPGAGKDVSASGSGGVEVSTDLTFAEAWERSLNLLHFKGYPIRRADKKDGTIETEKKVMLLGEAQVDCPEFHRFPYIENKRVIKYVSHTITIGRGDRTRIRVVADVAGQPGIAGKGTAVEADAGSARPSCASRMILERELASEIVSPMEPQ